jgi:hypothetical protein
MTVKALVTFEKRTAATTWDSVSRFEMVFVGNKIQLPAGEDVRGETTALGAHPCIRTQRRTLPRRIVTPVGYR